MQTSQVIIITIHYWMSQIKLLEQNKQINYKLCM